MSEATYRENELLTDAQAEDYLTLARGVLRVWRCRRKGPMPKWVKLGSTLVRYRKSDLDEFLRSQTVEPAAVAS